ncbi:MAG TPA: Rieske (2Fe-2S) protein [Motilibacteraceae bacterium]|nr:Rieske (2Fe-2S) protein [Motilibacteraceae bacterium]
MSGCQHGFCTSKGTPRREVLRGAGVLGAAIAAAPLLAACGSGGSSSPAKPSGPGQVLTATSQVPVGGGVITSAAVVVQPTAGDFKAFSPVCTHAGCIVSQVTDGVIYCACHGSEFSIKDGSVVQGPATQPLPPISVTVKGNDVVTA